MKVSHLSCQGAERSGGLDTTPAFMLQTPEKAQSPSLWTVGATSDVLFIFTASHRNFHIFHRPLIFLGTLSVV